MPTDAGVPVRPQIPRLVIDGRMVGEVPHGFARYVVGLAAGLRRAEQRSGTLPYEPVFLIRPGLSAEAARAFAGFGTCVTGARFLSPLELVELPRLLRRLGAAAYHSPTFSSLFAGSVPCPWIVTVHDLNHLQYGGRVQKLYYEKLLKPFVRGAARVASVSRASRDELAKWADVAPDSVALAYNALDPAFAERVPTEAIEAVLARHGLRRGKYFFSLTNLKPHKNVPRLVEAYGAYRAGAAAPEGMAWDLALNLAPGKVSAAPGLRLVGAPSDADARALMAGAGAVVFASRYEGFGLPPVEAASLGVPLVVSRIAPHREALADLEQGEVLWVDPDDTAAWTKALARATRGEVLGASVESRSRLMKRFSTFALGAEMDGIYRQTLKLPIQPPV